MHHMVLSTTSRNGGQDNRGIKKGDTMKQNNAPNTRKNFLMIIGFVIVIAALTLLFTGNQPPQHYFIDCANSEPQERSFSVHGFDFGYLIKDENGNELQDMQLCEGDTGKITFTSDHGKLGAGHGMAFSIGSQSYSVVSSGEPSILKFSADQAGTVSFVCNIFCGTDDTGHEGHHTMGGHIHILSRAGGLPQEEFVYYDIARHPADLPPPIERKTPETVKIYLEIVEARAEVMPGITTNIWTYRLKGTDEVKVPGPMIRVREGDTVELTIENLASNTQAHNVDFHATDGIDGGLGGPSSLKPGEKTTLKFDTNHPGAFFYHCAEGKIQGKAEHASKMYGLLVVEPKEGLTPVDREFYVVQGEHFLMGDPYEGGHHGFAFDKMRDENPDFYVFNGRPGALMDHPLQTYDGETVRIFFANGGVVVGGSAFHVIGEIFDNVYLEGGLDPDTAQGKSLQTTMVPAGGATIVEFKVNKDPHHPDDTGTRVLVDHALARLSKGNGKAPLAGLLKVSPLEEKPLDE